MPVKPIHSSQVVGHQSRSSRSVPEQPQKKTVVRSSACKLMPATDIVANGSCFVGASAHVKVVGHLGCSVHSARPQKTPTGALKSICYMSCAPADLSETIPLTVAIWPLAGLCGLCTRNTAMNHLAIHSASYHLDWTYHWSQPLFKVHWTGILWTLKPQSSRRHSQLRRCADPLRIPYNSARPLADMSCSTRVISPDWYGEPLCVYNFHQLTFLAVTRRLPFPGSVPPIMCVREQR